MWNNGLGSVENLGEKVDLSRGAGHRGAAERLNTRVSAFAERERKVAST